MRKRLTRAEVSVEEAQHMALHRPARPQQPVRGFTGTSVNDVAQMSEPEPLEEDCP